MEQNINAKGRREVCVGLIGAYWFNGMNHRHKSLKECNSKKWQNSVHKRRVLSICLKKKKKFPLKEQRHFGKIVWGDECELSPRTQKPNKLL